MHLLIVESPTKAATLQSLLGPGYRVCATEGHLYDLPSDALGIDLEDTFAAQWKTAKGQRNVLAGLRRDALDCDAVLLATDPDREGEAIAHHLADALARTQRPTKRVAFAEVTKPAVHEALARPRPLDARLVEAQEARRVVDRLIGYSISPHLQRAVTSPRPLSAGRVQTAALRLLCEREYAIADFMPSPTWHVDATFATEDGTRFGARLVRAYRQAPDDDTLDDGAARHLADAARGCSYTVQTVRRTEKALKPPPPLTTAALLQVASEQHQFRPAETLRAAQQLYEGVELENDVRTGLLTYPRTDSTRLADTAIAAVRHVIARDYGVAYLPDRPLVHRTSETSQEAHEAIRPTDFERTPRAVRKYLTPTQYRVYALAYGRAVTSQMLPATVEQTRVEVADAEGRFVFRAEGAHVTARGFLQFGGAEPETTPPPPLLDKDTPATLRGVQPTTRVSAVPSRFSEADLVGALETHGIGRPSTYASTLDTLRERGYATLEDRRLHPTDLGLRVSAFLVHRFPSLFDLGFTAQLEAGLDAIAAGREGYTAALRRFYHGRLVPALEFKPPAVTASGAALPTAPEPCERCGHPMQRRQGPHGAFLGCSNFPTCRNARPIVEATGVACPKCGNGQLVARTSRKGQSFYGCSRFPACRHSQSELARVPSPSQ